MIEQQGDLFKAVNQPKTWLVFTANSMVTRDHRLVIGAGIAKTVRDMFPDIDAFFGTLLEANGLAGKCFGIAANYTHNVIALQTKIDWRDGSPLDLVRNSCYLLGQFASFRPAELFMSIRPGCGLGHLDWTTVKPLISPLLPDNVHIYDKSTENYNAVPRQHHASLNSSPSFQPA